MHRRVMVFLGVALLLIVQACIISGYAAVSMRTELARRGDGHGADVLSPFLEFGRSVDRWTSAWYGASTPEHRLPSYTLTIDQDQWQRLMGSLPGDAGQYQSDLVPWVPAVFTAEGQPMEVHARVYGESATDWSRPKKSWEIRFDDAHAFHGMRHLLLLLPEEHGWFQNLLLERRSKKWGLLYPESEFITLMINGVGPMVYLSEEGWTEEMAQRQGRGGDVALYRISSTRGGILPATGDSAYWRRTGTEEGRIPDDALAALLRLSEPGAETDPHYLVSLGNVIDVDRLTAFIALRLSMGNPPALDDSLQLLYRSDRGIFEPVMLELPMTTKRSILAPSGIPLIDAASRVPAIRSKTHALLADALAHDQRDDAAFIAALRKDVELPLYADRRKLPSNRVVRAALDRFMALFSSNNDDLQQQIRSAEVLVSQHRPVQDGNVLLTIDVNARGPVAAFLSSIRLPERYREELADGGFSLARDTGDGVLGSEDVSVPTVVTGSTLVLMPGDTRLLWPGNPAISPDGELLRPPHRRHRFFLIGSAQTRPLTIDALPLPLDIRNAVTDGSGTILGTALVDDRAVAEAVVPVVSQRTFLAKHPAFSAYGGSGILLKGAVTIDGVVVIPPNLPLTVAPGTHIRMGSGASLLSFSSVSMLGEKQMPISIRPERDGGSWGVWAVIDAAEPSDVHSVQVEGGKGLSYGGRMLPGSIAMMDSPGSISDVVVSHAQGPAAIFLSQLYVEMHGVAVQDAADGGIVVRSALAGRMEKVSLESIAGDAVDLRGSSIILRDINVQKAGGACVHASERSAPLMEKGFLEQCARGVFTENGGHMVIRDSTLVGNAAALVAGGGTPAFGPGSILASDVVFVDNVNRVFEGSGGIVSVE